MVGNVGTLKLGRILSFWFLVWGFWLVCGVKI
jgi:hypothetical protein